MCSMYTLVYECALYVYGYKSLVSIGTGSWAGRENKCIPPLPPHCTHAHPVIPWPALYLHGPFHILSPSLLYSLLSFYLRLFPLINSSQSASPSSSLLMSPVFSLSLMWCRAHLWEPCLNKKGMGRAWPGQRRKNHPSLSALKPEPGLGRHSTRPVWWDWVWRRENGKQEKHTPIQYIWYTHAKTHTHAHRQTNTHT